MLEITFLFKQFEIHIYSLIKVECRNLFFTICNWSVHWKKNHQVMLCSNSIHKEVVEKGWKLLLYCIQVVLFKVIEWEDNVMQIRTLTFIYRKCWPNMGAGLGRDIDWKINFIRTFKFWTKWGSIYQCLIGSVFAASTFFQPPSVTVKWWEKVIKKNWFWLRREFENENLFSWIE